MIIANLFAQIIANHAVYQINVINVHLVMDYRYKIHLQYVMYVLQIVLVVQHQLLDPIRLFNVKLVQIIIY